MAAVLTIGDTVSPGVDATLGNPFAHGALKLGERMRFGRSTTEAVVKSIFMVVMVDLIFTTLFYITAAH